MRRVSLLLLTALLCAGLLAGCGTETTSSGGGTAPDSSDNGFSYEVVDLEKKVIKIGGFGDEYDLEAWDAIAEEFNCSFQYVLMDNLNFMQDLATAASAGSVYANLIYMGNYSSPAFYLSGLAADVSKIESLKYDTLPWDSFITETNTIGGVPYAVAYDKTSYNMHLLTFNKTLADQLGIENLYDAVRNGTWTFEKFEQVSQKAVDSTNGATLGLIPGSLSPHCYGYANGSAAVTKDADGKYIFTGTNDAFLSGLQFIRDYRQKGLIRTDVVGNDWGITESRSFMNREELFHEGEIWVAKDIFSAYMEDDFGLLPLPKGPDAEKCVGIIYDQSHFSFLEGDPDIENVAKLLVAFASKNAKDMSQLLEEEYAPVLRDDDSLEMLRLMYENPVNSSFDTSFLGSGFTDAIMDSTQRMSKTPKESMDGISPLMQAILDDNLN